MQVMDHEKMTLPVAVVLAFSRVGIPHFLILVIVLLLSILVIDQKEDSHLRRLAKRSHRDPRTEILKDHHQNNAHFRDVSDSMRSQLTESDTAMLRKFVKQLKEAHCKYDEKSFQSISSFLLQNFTIQEQLQWSNPARGVIRSLNAESTVPCEQLYWVPDGHWQAIPMWSHCCNQGAALAKCPSPVMSTPSTCTPSTSMGKGCTSDGTLLCPDYLTRQNSADCLVYTFGIADQWEFEDWAGSMNCEVHAHDPTTKFKEAHDAHRSNNVHFHYQGLGVPGGSAQNMVFQGYGALEGEMVTLGDLWRHHGHAEQKRPISMIKIDCEGCEWESLHQLATNEPEIISQVCTIIMEIHVSTTLQMDTVGQLKLMASFWENYIETFGFRFWFLHANPGARVDQLVNPVLLGDGLDPMICCYEIALRRPTC